MKPTSPEALHDIYVASIITSAKAEFKTKPPAAMEYLPLLTFHSKLAIPFQETEFQHISDQKGTTNKSRWKKHVRLTRKWQKTASIGRKRIASARANKNMAAAIHSNKSSLVDKGCFAIYTMDKRPLVIPLVFLDNCIVILNCLPCETRVG
ncbi:hypothetical protein V6N13_069353 [Hibiscus sabdariffa]